jgi:hypothetical protein
MLEKSTIQFILPTISDGLVFYLDSCRIITELQTALTNSNGCSELFFAVRVSTATANKFIMAYPDDGIITNVTNYQSKTTEKILHDGTWIDTLKSKQQGWKIRTLAALSVYRDILSPNATWVSVFSTSIFIFVFIFIFIFIGYFIFSSLTS